MKKLILIIFSFMLFGCSYKFKCRTATCKEHFFVDGYSGKKITLHYPLVWRIDSVSYYSYSNNKNKVIGFELITTYNNKKEVKNKSNSNFLTEEMKKSYKEQSQVNKLIFKNFIVVDEKGNKIRTKGNKKITIIYFPIEYPE